MIYFIYLIIVISFLDTFAQLPIIAPFSQSLGANSLLTGLIIGMYSLTNMGGNIIAGQWIDAFGRKKILIIGMLFVSICLFSYTFVKTAEQLLLIRFFHGIGGGLLVPAAFAFLSDRTDENSRGKTMAFSGAAVGISAIIGPAFGGITKQILGIDWVFYIITILFLITALFTSLLLKEDYIIKEQKEDTFNFKPIIKLFKKPPLINAYIGAFALMLTLGILAYMLPLKVEQSNLTAAFSGLLLSTFGIVAILVFLLPTNKLFDKVRPEKMVLIGMLLVTIALLILSFFKSIVVLFVAMVFYGLGFAFIFPSVTALIVDHSQKTERGRAFGLFYAFFSLGVVTGSFVIGALNVPQNVGLFVGAIFMLFFTLVVLSRVKHILIYINKN